MADFTEPNQDLSATVLLVEDDRPLLSFFSSVLRQEGYKVLEAVNGVEALMAAESQSDDRIDILLSDVAMPYMDGIQLAERLREIWPDIQVLLTSGLPVQEVRDRFGLRFKAEFLPKPFSIFDLTARVRRFAAAV